MRRGRRCNGGKIILRYARDGGLPNRLFYLLFRSLESAMATFRKGRELLLLSYDDGHISEDEFLLLYDANNSKNPNFSYQNYEHFGLKELDESESLAEFRFRKRDMPLLAEAMKLPDSYTCEQGTLCDGIEGLCLLSRRLAYPCRL